MSDAARERVAGMLEVAVDRLTFGGNIIETGTDSFRLAQTRARTEQAAD